MPVSISVNLDTLPHIRALGRVPRNISSLVDDGFRRVVQPRALRTLRAKLSGENLGVRTGTTRRAAFSLFRHGQLGPEVVAGVDLRKAPGARLQELGGVVRGRPNLAIPLDAAQTRQQRVRRFRAREVIGNPQRFRFERTFTRAGVIFGVRGDRALPFVRVAAQRENQGKGVLATDVAGGRRARCAVCGSRSGPGACTATNEVMP